MAVKIRAETRFARYPLFIEAAETIKFYLCNLLNAFAEQRGYLLSSKARNCLMESLSSCCTAKGLSSKCVFP